MKAFKIMFVAGFLLLCCLNLDMMAVANGMNLIVNDMTGDDATGCVAASETYKRSVHQLLMGKNGVIIDDGRNEMADLPKWPSKMLDATGRWPNEALAQGNAKWLGNITDCLRITGTLPDGDTPKAARFQGQYCKAILRLGLITGPDINLDLMIDGSLSNSTYVDIYGGICWPSFCTTVQTEQQFASLLRMVNMTFEDFIIDKDGCFVKELTTIDVAFIVAITFCFMFGCLVLMAAFYSTWDNDIDRECFIADTKLVLMEEKDEYEFSQKAFPAGIPF